MNPLFESPVEQRVVVSCQLEALQFAADGSVPNQIVVDRDSTSLDVHAESNAV